MADYHVGCGIAGIYAGVLRKNGHEWKDKTCVTEEALEAVRDWLLEEKRPEDERYGYCWRKPDGEEVWLTVTVKRPKGESREKT